MARFHIGDRQTPSAIAKEGRPAVDHIKPYLLSEDDARHPDRLAHLSPRLESLGAPAIVDWAVAQYGPGLVLASSFGAEDMVLVDLLAKAASHPHIFYLDTGYLFPETLALIPVVEKRYRLRVVRVTPALDHQDPAMEDEPKLWARDPDQCCRLRKVQPLTRYLQGHNAWMTGIRRDQTPFRAKSPAVGWDARHGLVKINPLVAWTLHDVFAYLTRHDVPYNPLHDQGYPSIGCVPCTKPVAAGQDPRAGRWAGQEKTECGLHL